MNREYKGFTKRWRKRWAIGLQTDHVLWILMDYFIDHANYKDGPQPYYHKGTFVRNIDLKRGQHVASILGLSKFLKASRNKIELRLKRLCDMEFLKIEEDPTHSKTHSNYFIATVLNYNRYQDSKSPNPQQYLQQGHSNPNENPQQYLQQNPQHFSESNCIDLQEILTKKNPEPTAIPTAKPNVKPTKTHTHIKEVNNKRNNIYKEQALEVLAYLNEKKGSKYTDASTIIARLNEGKTFEDCIAIIDNKFADPFFVENPRHLNPTTLFRPKNWDKYLNDIPQGLQTKKMKEEEFKKKQAQIEAQQKYITGRSENIETDSRLQLPVDEFKKARDRIKRQTEAK